LIRPQILASAVLLSFFAGCATGVDPFSRTPYGPQAAASSAFQYGSTVDFGDVDEEPMALAFAQFRALVNGGSKRITLRIDSFGGSIFLGHKVGRAMEDLKKANGVHVVCVVDGAAYSMAAVILESPLCDLRLATPRSTILFHHGRAGVRGTAEDLREGAEFLEAMNLSMALSVVSRLGCPLAAYMDKIAHRDWVMAVPEALATNVIDGVVSPNDIAPPAHL
jgi:ATP-dependent protease ClpP protease subunit